MAVGSPRRTFLMDFLVFLMGLLALLVFVSLILIICFIFL